MKKFLIKLLRKLEANEQFNNENVDSVIDGDFQDISEEQNVDNKEINNKNENENDNSNNYSLNYENDASSFKGGLKMDNKEVIVPKKRKRSFKKKFICFIIGVIVFIGCCIPFAQFMVNHGWITSVNEDTLNTEYIKTELQDKSDLITQRYEQCGTMPYKTSRKYFKKLTESVLIFNYTGVVNVGYDLSELNVSGTNKRVVVTLPKEKIIDSYIDADSIDVKYEKEGFFNEIKIDDVTGKLIPKMKKKMLKEAEKEGVMEKARENAKAIIKEQVEKLCDEEVEIVVR